MASDVPPVQRVGNARPTYEYQISVLPILGGYGQAAAMTAALNQLGAQGWEFVQFVTADLQTKGAGLFKRIV